MAQFLVEAYEARRGGDAVHARLERLRRAATELSRRGSRIRYLQRVFVPQDELCLYLFESASVDAVREALALAAVQYERIVETEEVPREPVD